MGSGTSQPFSKMCPHRVQPAKMISETADWMPNHSCLGASFSAGYSFFWRPSEKIFPIVRRKRPGLFFAASFSVAGSLAGTATCLAASGTAPHQNLDSWAAEDMYFSVYEELCAMVQAGFEHPECFWRRGPIAILGARL